MYLVHLVQLSVLLIHMVAVDMEHHQTTLVDLVEFVEDMFQQQAHQTNITLHNENIQTSC